MEMLSPWFLTRIHFHEGLSIVIDKLQPFLVFVRKFCLVRHWGGPTTTKMKYHNIKRPAMNVKQTNVFEASETSRDLSIWDQVRLGPPRDTHVHSELSDASASGRAPSQQPQSSLWSLRVSRRYLQTSQPSQAPVLLRPSAPPAFLLPFSDRRKPDAVERGRSNIRRTKMFLFNEPILRGTATSSSKLCRAAPRKDRWMWTRFRRLNNFFKHVQITQLLEYEIHTLTKKDHSMEICVKNTLTPTPSRGFLSESVEESLLLFCSPSNIEWN